MDADCKVCAFKAISAETGEVVCSLREPANPESCTDFQEQTPIEGE